MIRVFTALIFVVCALPAWAGLMTTTLPVDPMGGYNMTPVPLTTAATGTTVNTLSLTTPLAGDIEFRTQSGSLLDMVVDTPSWWQHGNDPVYTTSVDWVEIILPANTQAFSFYVGATWANAGGWWQAFDNNGNDTGMLDFTVNNQNTPGFGVWNTDSCGTISKIIVEPQNWGVGDFAISQGNCSTVPEPTTLVLLSLALFSLGFNRRKIPEFNRL